MHAKHTVCMHDSSVIMLKMEKAIAMHVKHTVCMLDSSNLMLVSGEDNILLYPHFST